MGVRRLHVGLLLSLLATACGGGAPSSTDTDPTDGASDVAEVDTAVDGDAASADADATADVSDTEDELDTPDTDPADTDADPADTDADPADTDADPADTDADPADTDADTVDATDAADTSDATDDAPPCPDGDLDGFCDPADTCPGFDDAQDADEDAVPDGCDICASGDDAADSDHDEVPDACDACVDGDDRVDLDGDGVPNACDACAGFDDTGDADRDGVPDGCDVCATGSDAFDDDGDGVPNACDRCAAGDDRMDGDADGVADACDACVAADDSADVDGDGVADGCDICAGGRDDLDSDGDSVPDACDLCASGADAEDGDEDGAADACDRCPGSNDAIDGDGDGSPDGCDRCLIGDDTLDIDADGAPDACDICGGGDDTLDADGDANPDACDLCPGGDDADDLDGDGVPDACDACAGHPDWDDPDDDGVPAGCDTCPFGDQTDSDVDGVADACDACEGFDDQVDTDADGAPDDCDTCALGDDFVDGDGDGVADACDICPDGDDALDTDGDGIPNACDTCVGGTADDDGDGVPNDCDVCAGGDDAADSDDDSVPDECDLCRRADDRIDTDGDLTPDCADDCPTDPDKVDPGICGCFENDQDSDRDGTANCHDECPTDATKVVAGVCGCAMPETDSDDDGTPDCDDGCPADPAKTVPLVCGCGVGETDSDDDGSPDCVDACDADPDVVVLSAELCNGIDDDCDGTVDEGVVTDGAGCKMPTAPTPSPLRFEVQFNVRGGGSLGPAGSLGYATGGTDGRLSVILPQGLTITPATVGLETPRWDDLMPYQTDVYHPSGLLGMAGQLVTFQYNAPDVEWTSRCFQVLNAGYPRTCHEFNATGGGASGIGLSFTAGGVSTCTTCWPATLTHGPVWSERGPTSGRLWGRTDAIRAVTLHVGLSPAAASTAPMVAGAFPSPTDDFTFALDLYQLAPGTRYYYELRVAGVVEHVGSFQTLARGPSVQTSTAYLIGSASGLPSSWPGGQPFERAFGELADTVVLTGNNADFLAAELEGGFGGLLPPDLSSMWAHYRELARDGDSVVPATSPWSWASVDRSARANLLAEVSTLAIWGERDFLGDGTSGVRAGLVTPERDRALRAFLDYQPTTTSRSRTDGAWYSASIGPVDYLMLDTTYERDSTGGVALGATQLAWVESTLRDSTATWVVLVGGLAWSPEDASGWAMYPTEHDAILDAIAAHADGSAVLVSTSETALSVRAVPSRGRYPLVEVAVGPTAASGEGVCALSNQPLLVSDAVEACFDAPGELPGFAAGLEFSPDAGTPRVDVHLSGLDVPSAASVSLGAWRDIDSRHRGARPDYNGDGFADLAAGAPGADVAGAVGAGTVQVLYGSNACFQGVGSDNVWQALVSGASEAGDRFGEVMTWGDFDGDGFDELVVGVPREAIGTKLDAGAITVFNGGVDGIGAHGGFTWSQDSANITGSTEPGDFFGAALTAGEFNCDGYDDLAIGVPGENDSEGHVYVIYGSPDGLDPLGVIDIQDWDEDGVDALSSIGEEFGAALTSGDFDGNSCDDLAIGAPAENSGVITDTGTVYVLYCVCDSAVGLTTPALSAGARAPTRITRVSGLVDGEEAANDRFGSALAAGDMGSDGRADLLIGAPGVAPAALPANGGPVWLGRGSAAGLQGVAFTRTDFLGFGRPTDPSMFGASLATVRESSLANRGVWATGTGDGAGGLLNGGRVATVLDRSGATPLYVEQAASRRPVSTETEDQFGSAVSLLDCNADGHAELVVGAAGEAIGSVARAGIVTVHGLQNGVLEGPDFVEQRWFGGLPGFSWPAEAGEEFGAAFAKR